MYILTARYKREMLVNNKCNFIVTHSFSNYCAFILILVNKNSFPNTTSTKEKNEIYCICVAGCCG